MKLNKRVLASVALSVSLVGAAVTPVAWAADGHRSCAQNFQDGIDADINLVVAKHLRRNCNLSVEQISVLSVDAMKEVAREFKKDGAPLYAEEQLKGLSPQNVVNLARGIDTPAGDNSNGPTDGEQQSGPALSVKEVKAGDTVITGSVYLLPGEQKIIQAQFPSRIVKTKVVRFSKESGEAGETAKGKVVTFNIDVPDEIQLKANDEVTVSRLIDNSQEATNKDRPVTVIVKPADNGNDEAPGGGDGQNPPMPPGDNENPPKPPAPGGDAGESSSDLGSIFGVIAGLAGLAAVVASVAKIFNHSLGLVRFLQPVRDFLAQFNIKF